ASDSRSGAATGSRNPALSDRPTPGLTTAAPRSRGGRQRGRSPSGSGTPLAEAAATMPAPIGLGIAAGGVKLIVPPTLYSTAERYARPIRVAFDTSNRKP